MKVQGVICIFLVDPVPVPFWMQDMEHLLRDLLPATKAQGTADLHLEWLNTQLWFYVQSAKSVCQYEVRFVAAQRFDEEHENFELSCQKTEYPIQKPFVPLCDLESTDVLNILPLEARGSTISLLTTVPLENLEESLEEVSSSLSTLGLLVSMLHIIVLFCARNTLPDNAQAWLRDSRSKGDTW